MDEPDASVQASSPSAASAIPQAPIHSSHGIDIRLHSVPAGVTTMAPQRDHLISIYAGAPVRVACDYAGRTHRR
jgi:hypothetical protein